MGLTKRPTSCDTRSPQPILDTIQHSTEFFAVLTPTLGSGLINEFKRDLLDLLGEGSDCRQDRAPLILQVDRALKLAAREGPPTEGTALLTPVQECIRGAVRAQLREDADDDLMVCRDSRHDEHCGPEVCGPEALLTAH